MTENLVFYHLTSPAEQKRTLWAAVLSNGVLASRGAVKTE